METSALLNSGFESEAPDVVLPVELAKRLGLWPPTSPASTVLEAGGGEVAVPYHEAALEVELALEDRGAGRILVNALIDPYVG